jgi:hypothetical protein
MAEAQVIVVGETRSLGLAVAELFASDCIDAVLVGGLDEAERHAAARPTAAPFVLVAAASGRYCETLERWPTSSLRGADLVVVGARELVGTGRPRLHLVPLPLEPHRLLALVRMLLGEPPRPRAGYSESPGIVRTPPLTYPPPHRDRAWDPISVPHLPPM